MSKKEIVCVVVMTALALGIPLLFPRPTAVPQIEGPLQADSTQQTKDTIIGGYQVRIRRKGDTGFWPGRGQ